MATNLHTLALAQKDEVNVAADSVAKAHADFQDERDRRAASPSPVTAMETWVTECGATQHAAVVATALAENRVAQQVERDEIAAIPSPADATTHVVALRTLLITEAALKVEARSASERQAAVAAALESTAVLKASAEAERENAAQVVQWAEVGNQRREDLRALLGTPEVVATEAEATARLTSLTSPRVAASDRLDVLVPSQLRDRGVQRFAEAALSLDTANNHSAVARDARDQLAIDAQASEAPLRIAKRDLEAATVDLSTFVSSATAQLERATAMYVSIAGHPDLSTAQASALDSGANPSGVAAAGSENDLMVAVEAAAEKQRDVDNAILNVRASDVDVDPAADAAVVAAEAALADASVQDPLTAALVAYDGTARAALDRWEVEVPATLWDALLNFSIADRELARLAYPAVRAAVLQGVGDAEDDVAKALEDRNDAVRTEWAVELAYIERETTHLGIDPVVRAQQYFRGDRVAGRTPAEL